MPRIRIGGQLFVISATAAVVARDGVAHGTSASLRSRKDRLRLRGIQLSFEDAGVPSPESPA